MSVRLRFIIGELPCEAPSNTLKYFTNRISYHFTHFLETIPNWTEYLLLTFTHAVTTIPNHFTYLLLTSTYRFTNVLVDTTTAFLNRIANRCAAVSVHPAAEPAYQSTLWVTSPLTYGVNTRAYFTTAKLDLRAYPVTASSKVRTAFPNRRTYTPTAFLLRYTYIRLQASANCTTASR